jgi:type III restriction enzyme
MFYQLIQNKRDLWFQSPDCTVRDLVDYIYQRGMMRDAQIDAIKTYLYLKIACQGQPLWKLFAEGKFNITDVDAEEINVEARDTMMQNPAALALYQYSRQKDRNGTQIAPELEQFIRQHAREIDYEQVLKDIFYGVTYSDYLFSLPMGAGKTYLMAAFIYIDLYFAQNEPMNPIWAHNFLILAPSGLKSSIIPSLRSIQNFDVSWLFPEATVASLKRLVKFEVLDELKSAKNSNLVKNPNARKINQYLQDGAMMGLVAVTNAEKVILDRWEENDEKVKNAFSDDELRQLTIANELRHTIGKIPSLSIFIDEVHHASDGEIKLRQVVTQWATANKSFCNVLGFSGTPYVEKAEKVTLGGSFDIKNTNITNVVYYYPLIEGIDNFLKRPEVKLADNDMLTIVNNGVHEFLDKYKDTVYADGTCAKLAVYCGQIPALEEEIYPLVSEIVTEYGLNPAEVILKRHKGSSSKKVGVKKYPEPEGSEAAFTMLDSSSSKVRIILLVQIGKEGWDCKSLTGVILPHEGACHKNMVLQTSCRCLRQVIRGEREKALIWMNKWNADKLNRELKQQQNITLQEFGNKPETELKHIERHSRMDKMQVPPIDFYQLKVEYEIQIVEEQPDTTERFTDLDLLKKADASMATVQDLTGKIVDYQQLLQEEGECLSYHWWLEKIVEESFETLSIENILQYDLQLHSIFEAITKPMVGGDGERRMEDAKYDHQQIRASIRKVFVPKRDYTIVDEVVPETASILSVERPKPLDVLDDSRFYPSQETMDNILAWDANPEKGDIPQEVYDVVEKMRKMGMVEEAQTLLKFKNIGVDTHPERNQTYHYLPYRFDSNLEKEYFVQGLIPMMKAKQLEYYFNGDETLTEFKIRCYRKVGKHWEYDGLYYPDFLVLSRDAEGKIDRVCIIETKGEGYAAKFKERKDFMEKVFVPQNNQAFRRERFHYLYLKDTDSFEKRMVNTMKMINEFFKD